MFCFFSMAFLEGLGIWPLILFFTSLLWQLSCKAWHSKKKKISMSGWNVLFPWFEKAWDVWRLTSQPSLLVTQLFDERWIGKKRRNVMIQWHGDVLDSLVCTWVPVLFSAPGRECQLKLITQTRKQCFVLCDLYHHLLLIASQSWQFHLQIYQSDHHPYQTGLVLGFPTVCCHLGSLAS